MKQILLTLTLLFSLCSFRSFANDDKATPAVVVASFQSAFRNATEVGWSVTGQLFKASFTMNGQYISAYYDGNAQLIALTRNISSIQLPISLQASVKKNYENYWVSDLFELSNEDGPTYYITLEDGENKVVLKSSGAEWSSFQKLRKS